MKANTAAGFACAGSALLLSRSRTPLEKNAGIACSIAVAVLGVMTLSQYVGGWNLGIDEMLFADADADAPDAPGRMAPMSALGFLLAGTALGLLRLPASRCDFFAQACAALLLALSLVAITGYAFGAKELYRLGPYVSVALHTALTFMVLSIGILLANINRGWMPVLISDGAGGAMLRRLLLPSLATLFAVACLRLWGQRLGWYDTALGLSLMVIVSGALLSLLIWLNAMALNRLYATSELDKSRLRKSDARLRQAEALQHAIVTSPNFAIVATDEKGTIQLFNVGAERMLGFGPAEIINKIRPSEIQDPKEGMERAKALSAEFGTTIAPGFEALVYKASRGIDDAYELTYIRKDGSRFPALVSTTALRADSGEIIGYLLISTDISERRQAEAARRLTNQRFEIAVKASQVALFQQDLELRYTWLQNAVPGFEDFFSIGKRDGDLMERAADAAVTEALKREVIRSGVSHRQEVVVHVQGVGRQFDLLVEPLRDAAGLIAGVTGVAIDITERKAAEAARHEREQQYRALAEASSEVAYRMSADWSTMLPLDGRQLVASSDQPLADWAWLDQNIPRDEHPRVRQAISDAIARKALFELEHRVRRPDGTTGWTLSRAVPIFNENEEVIEWFGAAIDITERKQVELNLTYAIAVAEKANSAKTRFLASMSHELRTPLNAILGFAQLMDSDSPARTPSDRRSVGQILKAGWFLLELINEILDLALIESGKATISPEPIALAAVMLECQAMVEADALKRGLGITFPPSDIPYVVKADRTRLKQILVNFLTNAIKYNRPGGAISVACAPSPPDSIRISVRDTGEGMTPEQLARLFEPFNRLGKEGGVVEGTGIGLVVAKHLIELLGGTIGVESTVGVGSVFWIEMRLSVATEIANQNTTAALAGPRKTGSAPQRTVLYVEDNPANLQLVEEVIARRPDLRLLSATDGSDGIKIALAYQPEVILMDINLPGINGIDAMKILRAKPSTAHIPIIALSANAMSHDAETALAAGFFNYLTKPIQVNQLLQELDVALNFAQTTPRRSGKNKQETSL